ncbi:unnamed protein product [Staurois parvus]|uniref:PAN2-PAN3 deadenylation complex subunit PAN3 n=1 Tax=Staurois parvus TaxID=386267 RepID=A0ABN9G521_9NEOB|nr:unnamed protein product [Staurois parvus]
MTLLVSAFLKDERLLTLLPASLFPKEDQRRDWVTCPSPTCLPSPKRCSLTPLWEGLLQLPLLQGCRCLLGPPLCIPLISHHILLLPHGGEVTHPTQLLTWCRLVPQHQLLTPFLSPHLQDRLSRRRLLGEPPISTRTPLQHLSREWCSQIITFTLLLLSHVAYMQPKANAPSFFMADELRQELINRHLITMAQIDQADMPGVPAEVDSYHSLFPLEPLPPPNRIHKTSNFGYITSCYKAVNNKDDLTYCLRRVHGFRLVNTKCMSLVDTWKKVQHSNIVTLREMFTTKAFGEHSLVFAYDFHAGAETMMSRHFNDPSADGYFTKRKWGQHDGPLPRQHAGLLPESLIWAYIVQLSSALRTIHTAGLACRVMDPSKILITGKTRLHVNCAGIFDVLTYDGSQSNPVALMPQYQQADLISLGKVVLALSCNSLAGIQRENLQKAMELVNINYSSDLKNLILYLLTDQNRLRSVNDIMPMIGARFYTQLDAAQMRNDIIEEDLAKEVQNGRLFRLLAKLGTINERPEFQKDPAWSETGDRYLLKLFRDHLFHQVTEAGTPWIDLSHIVSCLNKLDAGVPEKISLISRDEKSVLVVTYSDLKRCFENTFQELVAAANGQL